MGAFIASIISKYSYTIIIVSGINRSFTRLSALRSTSLLTGMKEESKMNRAVRVFCFSAIILLAASAAYADALSLDLVGFSYGKTPYTMRDGTADGWVTITSNPSTGVNLNIGSNVSAYADIGKWEFNNWGEASSRREGPRTLS